MDDERRELVRRMLERRGIVTAPQHQISVRSDRVNVLSLPQQRLWFLHQLHPDSSACNLSAALRLSGSLNRPALERALASVVARHDALRSGFPNIGGEAALLVHPHVDVVVVHHDYADVDPREREEQVRKLLVAQADAPFDLARAPLVRAALVRLASDEHVLAITAHHIVFDGWSIAILIRELAAHYGAALGGAAADLPRLPIGYADFARRQTLADLPPTTLPSDRARPAVASLRGSTIRFALPDGLVDRLRNLGRAHEATLFMTLLAGYLALLGRYTGQSDVAIGSPIAGRAREEVEGLIGLFVNTLVLRGDLSGSPPFAERLRAAEAGAAPTHAIQTIPRSIMRSTRSILDTPRSGD